MSGDSYFFALKSASNFYAGRSYLSEMPTANAISCRDLDGALETALETLQPHCEELRSDRRLDLPGEVDDREAKEASARENTPEFSFGDIMRLLGMTFVIITAIDLSLKLFHLH